NEKSRSAKESAMKNLFKMNRRDWMTLVSGTGLAMRPAAAQTQASEPPTAADLDRVLPDQLLLKDYRPRSLYKIPVSEIQKAKYPAIDCHHHASARTQEQVDQEIRIMDAAGLESAVAFCPVGEGPPTARRLSITDTDCTQNIPSASTYTAAST